MTRGPIQCDVGVSYGLSRKGLPAPISFKRWAEAACQGRIKRADIAVRVVDEAEGRRLNHHYRGKDYATNVLSFPAELPEGVTLPILGDLVICAPVVAREAAEQDKTLSAHYAHLTIHGVLHLLGLDHENSLEADAMEAIERSILADFGYADPY
jgi:probable rRNA maturation factor